MKQFPRIYSISTVGLIFHYNSDYLLHPFRTDFNGESGIGKSMIADLLQLIFVAKRKYYKPGTDSTGSAGRNTNTLPLDSLGYAFINIQKEEKLFLTVGIYIQKSTGNVTPFIIQKGIHWEKNSQFEYQNRVLLHGDFLSNKNQIPEIEFLKKSILRPNGFILETFYNDINRYHQLLYFNKILPMDLSQDEGKLVAYAQIIQSFARAKTLSLKDRDFKNFLFADDEDIFEEYQKQITSLESYHRQYIEQRKAIERINDRFAALKLYRDAVIRKSKCLYAYWTAQTAYDYQQSISAQTEYVRLKREFIEKSLLIYNIQLNAAQYEVGSAQRQYDRVLLNVGTKGTEVGVRERELEGISTRLLSIKNQLNETQVRFENYFPINNGIKEFDALLTNYSTPEAIRTAIKEHPTRAQNKLKLQRFIDGLKAIGIETIFFEANFISVPYNESYRWLLSRLEEIQKDIKRYERLATAYSGEEGTSVMSWINSQNERQFTRSEESVLRHFIDLSTQKPIGDSGERYIPSPEMLLKNLEKTDDAETFFWINLGGVHEKIPTVKERMFNEGGNRPENVEEIVSALRRKTDEENNNYRQLSNLLKTLNTIGWSPETLELYINKNSILSFQEDVRLPTQHQFEQMNEWYSNREHHKTKYDVLNKEIKALRDKERDLVNDQSKLTAEVLSLKNEITDLNTRKANLLSVRNSKTLDARRWEEKIEGVKVEHHRFLEESTIKRASQTARISFEKYIIEEKVNTEKLYEAEILPLGQSSTAAGIKIGDFEDPLHSNGLLYLERKYNESRDRFLVNFGAEFNPLEQHPKYSKEAVEESRTTLDQAEANLTGIRENRIQDLLPENETIKVSTDIETIARELLPNVFEGKEIVNFSENLESVVMGHLRSINESMKQIDEHKIRLIQGIFAKVSTAYYDFEDKIKDIRRFFDEKEITGGMKVKVDFQPSSQYPIEWISSLRRQIGSKSINITPLFKGNDNDQTSAEEIIINTFRQHSGSKLKDPDISKLTNPKSYFTLEVSLVRPSGEKSDGSSGQDYAKIALLCIARLSRIERDKRKTKDAAPGIRFMPLDEVAGLGGNFNLLYTIAQEYDYQILTMTISPDLVLEDGRQYVYILNSNRESNERKINMPSFGLFSDTALQKHISDFIKAQTDAKRTNLENN